MVSGDRRCPSRAANFNFGALSDLARRATSKGIPDRRDDRAPAHAAKRDGAAAVFAAPGERLMPALQLWGGEGSGSLARLAPLSVASRATAAAIAPGVARDEPPNLYTCQMAEIPGPAHKPPGAMPNRGRPCLTGPSA